MKFNIRPNYLYPEKTLLITVDILNKYWEAWYSFVCKNWYNWDVDECQECWWISAEHLQDISEFIYRAFPDDFIRY